MNLCLTKPEGTLIAPQSGTLANRDRRPPSNQATQKDFSDSKIGFDFGYRCGIRKERLRPCLSQRSEAVYNFSLLEEVMKQDFQKVLKIKPPGDFFSSSGVFVFGEVIL